MDGTDFLDNFGDFLQALFFVALGGIAFAAKAMFKHDKVGPYWEETRDQSQ